MITDLAAWALPEFWLLAEFEGGGPFQKICGHLKVL